MTTKDKIRNCLNIIFMVLAVIGVIYYLTNRMVGTYIILIAMCFKIAESSLRMLNK